MNNAFNIFQNRKKEVNLYFDNIKLIDERINNNKINYDKNIYDSEFFKILKSSFILLLYNLVEATISSAMDDIYNEINGKYKYDLVIPEIKKIWINNKTESKNKPLTDEVIDSIITDIIDLKMKRPSISGNLDDDNIRKICKKHNIKFRHINGSDLKFIKERRNFLSHGINSFTDCARDSTIQDLEIIKDNVLNFISEILKDMKNYYDNKLFLSSPNNFM